MLSLSTILALSILTRSDIFILSTVASEYNLSSEQTRLLYAIYKCENGTPGREMGILVKTAQRYKGNHTESLRLQARWCAGTISKRYIGDLKAFGDIYCPIGADNDPSGLNKNWYNNVRYWMDMLK